METGKTFSQDREKLIEATLYLGELSMDDPNFDMAKLAKLLYYADCESYLHYGAPVTGTTYLHFPHGPYPENWYQVRQQMEHNGDAEILGDDGRNGRQSYRVLPLREADLERLSPTDRESLEGQVCRFKGYNGSGIEQYSHQELGWLSTEDGQPIPYELAGVFSPQLSLREIQENRPAS